MEKLKHVSWAEVKLGKEALHPEFLKSLIDHTKKADGDRRRFCLRRRIFYEQIFRPSENDCSLFFSMNLWPKMQSSCQDESIVDYLTSAQMTCRFQQRNYLTKLFSVTLDHKILAAQWPWLSPTENTAGPPSRFLRGLCARHVRTPKSFLKNLSLPFFWYHTGVS